MIFRFFIFLLALSFFSVPVQAAAVGAWNCEQNKNGEWTCLTDTTTAPAPPTQPAQAPVKNQTVPTPTAPIMSAQPEPKTPPVPAPVIQANPAPIVTAPINTPSTINKVEPDNTPVSANAETPVAASPKPRVHISQNQKPYLQKVEPLPEKVASQAKQAGWSCHADDEKQKWNCNLAGADPKGQPRPITGAEIESSSIFMKPTFNNSQENTFQMLRGEYKQDPWQGCQNWAIKKKPSPSKPTDRENAVTDVMADFSEAFQGEVLSFSGNVDLTRADQHLLAQSANYDTGAGTLDAQGSVVYSEGSIALSSESLSMNMNNNVATVRQSLFIAGDGPLRGSADTIYRDDEYLSRYNDTAFTSCAPGNQDWVIHASRLKVNRESGQGSAKDAWLEFKGAPVIYTPYISFPTDNRRLSGFLSPNWGSTQRSGFYFSAPFYWNIAPNFDTTVTPRYFSGRGEMISNKFRYLTSTSQGSLGTELMPNDQKLNKERYSLSLKDNSIFTDHLNSQVDMNLVSDSTYFNDLNNALGIIRSSYLTSKAFLNYKTTDVNASGGMQHFQSVDPTVNHLSMPYDLLPRVNFNYNHSFEGMPLRVSMDSQYTDFYNSSKVNGQRLVIWPSVAFPFESTAGFIIPKVSVQSVQYQLSNQTVAGTPANINRTLPVFSLDSGMSVEKTVSLIDESYNNIIEPRIFYLYIPRRSQNNIPIFDTSAFDINYNSLFRENSFSGYDRLQDANQITLAGSSRYVNSKTGLEPFKLSLGQILYFQDRNVTLTSLNQPKNGIYSGQSTATSNFITELSGQIDENLSYNTGAQWNTVQNRFARGQAMLRYRDQPDRIFDIGYRYRNANANPLITAVPGTSSIVGSAASTPATISLTDVSFRWPLFNDWYLLGRWQYSLNFNKTLESFMGLEKENCCWRFRMIGRRYINGATTSNTVITTNTNLTPETAFFVELELKGLSGIGDDVDTFLQSSLNGYRKAGTY